MIDEYFEKCFELRLHASSSIKITVQRSSSILLLLNISDTTRLLGRSVFVSNGHIHAQEIKPGREVGTSAFLSDILVK